MPRHAGSESATSRLPDRLGTLSCAQRAFEEVGGERDVMLWQTGEAQVFYEKLGARVVPTDNILDSSGSSGAEGAEGGGGGGGGAEGGAPRAFWDLVAMIYPVRTSPLLHSPLLPCGCFWLAAFESPAAQR